MFKRLKIDYKVKILLLNLFISILLIIGGLELLKFWFSYTPKQSVDLRVAQNIINPNEPVSAEIDIKGVFTKYEGTPSDSNGIWNRFRGEYSDNVNREEIALKDKLTESNLPILWKTKLGEGYAGAAIGNGCVYVMDYDKANSRDSLRCFSLNDGKEIWRRAYNITIKRNHGISRTVPAVSNKYVVTIGPKCQVMCVDAINGDYKWGLDLVFVYGSKVPLWYTAQCPIIDGNQAIIAPSGKVLMMGVELETGRILWETPNTDNWEMSHSSIIPMIFHGKRMYLYSSIGGIAAISTESQDCGKILWKTSEWSQSVISPSPVHISNNRFLVTAGYGGGSMIFEVLKNGEIFEAKKILKLDKTVFACEQHTPIFYNEHLFSILPNDSDELNRQMVCMDLNGKIIWSSGRDERFGLGPFIIADRKLFILNDDGVLTIANASVDKWEVFCKVKVLQGREAWAPIAMADGKMILRDFEEMICLDMRK